MLAVRTKIKSSPHKTKEASLDNNSKTKKHSSSGEAAAKTFAQNAKALSLGVLVQQPPETMAFPWAHLGLFPGWKLLR